MSFLYGSISSIVIASSAFFSVTCTTTASPKKKSSSILSIVSPVFEKWYGASTCVPVCVPITNVDKLYPSFSKVVATVTDGSGSPG